MKRLLILALAATAAVAACGDASDQSTPNFRPLQGENRFVMILPAASSPDDWKATAKDKCGAVEFCQVFGWTDPREAPQTFPMTDRELEAQAFSYAVNRATGYESAMWDCDRFPREDKSECGL